MRKGVMKNLVTDSAILATCSTSLTPFVCRATTLKRFREYEKLLRQLKFQWHFRDFQAVYKRGPVTFEIDTQEGFNYYKGGVYRHEKTCNGSNPDHVMLIIGWGYDRRFKLPYWLVKNSWTDGWGDQGYIRIERGRDVCGMERAVRYPLMHNYYQGY